MYYPCFTVVIYAYNECLHDTPTSQYDDNNTCWRGVGYKLGRHLMPCIGCQEMSVLVPVARGSSFG